MNIKNSLRQQKVWSLLAILLTVGSFLSACSDPEKAKAEHLRQGEAYLTEKKFQEASIEFRNAAQIDNNLAAAHWGLVQAYEGLERFPEALDELGKTIQLDQNHLDARVKMGNYMMLVNPPRLDDAERFAEEVLAKDPKHPEGYILKATVAYVRDPQKNRDAALALLNKAIEVNPNRIESHLSLSRFYEQIGDLAKSEESIGRAIALDDKSSLVHMTYAGFFVRRNRLDAAEAEFRKAVEVDPSNRVARQTLAGFYFGNTKQMDKAEEAFKALADLDGDKPEGRAILADFYSAVGRNDEAVKMFQDILTKSPEYTRARYRLGEVLLGRGDREGALKQADEVLAKNNRDAQALLLRARSNLQGGDPRKSIEDLKEVLNQDPRDRNALYFMADAHYRTGQIDQARVFSADLDRYHQNFYPGKVIQSQISLASGDAKAAKEQTTDLLNKLSQVTPNAMLSPQLLADMKAKSLTARGTANVRLGDLSAARADLDAARDLMPNSPSSYSNIATLLLGEGKADEAVQNYERALQIDAANYEALNGLVTAYTAQKRVDLALARVDQALAAQPNNSSLHFLKAQVYGVRLPGVAKTEEEFQHDVNNAEASLRRAIELDQDNIAAYKALAGLYVNMKQPERAIAEYQKVTERQPDAMTFTMMGMVEYGRNNLDAAVEDYKRALELDSGSTIAANNLAMLYADHGKGNLDEAVRLAQGAVQKNPNVPGYLNTLGWVYYKKGLHAAAIEQLQKAVTMSVASKTDNALYRYQLGVALADGGKKAEARRELQTALSLAEQEAKRPGGGTFTHAEDARQKLASL